LVAVGGGKVDAEGKLGVALAQPSGTLTIGRIAAPSGAVDLAASGDIAKATGGSGISTRTPAPLAVTATLYSRTGSVGSSVAPIPVTGGAVTAGASAGTVNVDSIYPVVAEAPPAPQPDAPLQPGQPRTRSVDAVTMSSTDTTLFTLAATGSDQVAVTGLAILDGTIGIALAAGFVPQAGDQFTIMSYQSVRGRFAAGRGLFGLSGDLWFEVVQTGDENTAGSVRLVVHEFLPGASAALSVANTLGADTSKDQIGTLLNHEYFGVDIQVSFDGGFTYGDVDVHGRVTLRYAPRYARYEMAIDGSATVGATFALSGQFLASVGVQQGGTVTSVAVVA
ncbi:MAG: hypothetical protein EBU70_16115, partial [Actinobacteria bacterium]|nr:hypothetical protein [Actinomycetota bacterium]